MYLSACLLITSHMCTCTCMHTHPHAPPPPPPQHTHTHTGDQTRRCPECWVSCDSYWKLTRLPPYTVAVLVYCHCYCTLTLTPFLPMCPIMCSLVGREEEREGGNDVLHIHFYVLRCLCVLHVSITFILLHNSFTCTYLLHVDSTCIRESVDSLCRDGADTPIVRVHWKAFLTREYSRFKPFSAREWPIQPLLYPTIPHK